MNKVYCLYALYFFVLNSIVCECSLAPFDVRIDHHKVETTNDLIVNTPRPRFSWKISVSDDALQRNIHQTAYQIQLESIKLTSKEKPFRWDSEYIVSSASIHVPYTNKNDLLPSTYYHVRIRIWTTNSNESSQWTDWIQFRTPIFDLYRYITNEDDLNWIGSTKINMNELRKEFTVPNTSPVKSAFAYVSGLGYYEFYFNGNKVDPSRKLDPGWTTYELRTLLVAYDITSNITIGTNAIGIKLGNGWYSQEQHGESAYGPPRLLFTLFITFMNGDEMKVFSDQTWTGREGSIKHDSVYNGEFCDSRNDRPNWARPGFNDSLSAWIMPDLLPSPVNMSLGGLIIVQDMPPIRAGNDALHFEVSTDEQQRSYLKDEELRDIKGARLTDGGVLKPINMWSSDSGLIIFDLGQNMAGWCRIKFHGPSGYGVYIRHGETITLPDIATNRSARNIYTENLRAATASDTYVLRGDPTGEVYEPTFTVHGFRYLSVFAPPNALTKDDVECPFVHSETTLKGRFSTSNPVVNQIQHNIQWGQLSNIMSLPTDCPQRNERRGWLGDAALSVDEALYNFDLIKFYQNFLNLIVDVQRSDGQVPNFVPGNSYPADSNWGTALPTITWQVYRHYHDLLTLESYYNNVVQYVEYLHNVYNTTGLVNFPIRYGDWVPPPPQPMTNKHLITSFGFLHDVYLLINMSQALNRKEDTNTYTILYQKLAEEFHRVFFNSSIKSYADGMQAAQVLALALPGVVPASVRSAVIDKLVTDIRQNENHVTTGIVSTAQIYPVLSDNGYHDLALELISSTTYPSYGYMFTNRFENATTIWELWNAPLTGPSMNSRNHIMYGSVGAWFYSHLAGIDLSSNILTIRPRMASEMKKHLMSKLDCQLSTLYGRVHVSYTRNEQDTAPKSILLRVTIPPNVQARVMFEPLFPGAQCQTLTENKRMIWSSNTSMMNVPEFIVGKDSSNEVMVVHVGSGHYEFHASWQ
ncbi:unnamed protein product [Adineta ricciae]|uniref:alpha-L-rhamnosidase n=1 Tax=Adineta ricciae TaxID=249248 RepID=A0A815RH63_ADIRI|nr:unnamed protein product [Adineta ricciae]